MRNLLIILAISSLSILGGCKRDPGRSGGNPFDINKCLPNESGYCSDFNPRH